MTAAPDQAAPVAVLRGLGDAAPHAAPVSTGPRRRSRPDRAPPDGCFAGLILHHDIAASAAAWALLQAAAPASPYQTFAWICAWAETEGRESGVRPLICVAVDAAGRPLALLPLGLRVMGPVTVAAFLGGRHSNYNLGLFDPAVTWSAREVARLLRDIAAAAPQRIDMFALTNQPHAWGEWANPLAELPHQASPSQGHSTALSADGETFLRDRLSSAARKKMRSKASQLGAMGPVRHTVGRSDAEVDTILDAYVEQKGAKLTCTGVAAGIDLSAVRRLLRRAASPGSGQAAPLEWHALRCGERIVATFAGLSHGGRFSGLVISHDADPSYARVSPGELLLAEVVRMKCSQGYAGFDLGIGEDRYKQSLCPTVDALFDTLVPVSATGFAFVAFEAFRLRVKRKIKTSRWAWGMVKRMRKRFVAGPPPR